MSKIESYNTINICYTLHDNKWILYIHVPCDSKLYDKLCYSGYLVLENYRCKKKLTYKTVSRLLKMDWKNAGTKLMKKEEIILSHINRRQDFTKWLKKCKLI